MKEAHVFRFTAGERVLGTDPESGAEHEMHYYVNDEAVAKLLGSTLDPLAADLVDLAAAIHIADRLAVRERGTSEDWRRRFQVDVPVRCLSEWRRKEVEESLCELLGFVTGDGWDIRFSSRPARPRFSERQSPLFPIDQDERIRVNLFSGGLDSFAGNAAALAQNPEVHYVCVSASPNRRQEHGQVAQVRALRTISNRSVTHVRIPCWIESATEVAQEPTRRTRGFLFLALGAVSALSVGMNQLFLYENGVGAINLPYERTPVGVPNSRSVHPAALTLMSRFIETLTGRQFTIENPCVFKTKGEMCSEPIVGTMAAHIGSTFSCDGFPVQRSGTPQCGACTSCILRRLALENSGLHKHDMDGYACDLYEMGQEIRPRRLRGLAAMDWQVERLRQALSADGGWPALMSEFPELRQACAALVIQTGSTDVVIQKALERLYRRHCDEWRNFPPRHWLAPQRKAA
jgi:7-cyano-7-deazaguanine synthase in queuosine biosynthesis